MTAQRQFDFRGGDLSEELGLLLLRGISAVAPVPRPEDVGIDAVSTLFRLEGDLLIAEAPFYVQLKAKSEKKIRFETSTKIAWLKGLKLPFLVGSVDKATATIELFGTNNLAMHLINTVYVEYAIYFKSLPKKIKPNVCAILLGDPILTWQATEIGTRELVEKAHSVLTPYLEVEQRNVELRPIRTAESIGWQTNRPGIRPLHTSQMREGGSIGEIQRLFRSMVPGLQGMAFNALNERKPDELVVAVQLTEVMRRYGHDPDPTGAFPLLLRELRRLAASASAAPPAPPPAAGSSVPPVSPVEKSTA